MTTDVPTKENVYFAAFCLLERDREPGPKCSWSQEDDRKPLRIWGWPQQEAGGNKGGDGACSETNDKETAGSRLEIQLLKQGCAKNPGQGLGSSGPQESPRIHQPLLRVLSTEIEGHLLSITGPPALLREASNSTNLDLQLRAKAGPRPTQQGERMPT